MHKDEILRALFSYLDPYDFYPCYYKELANHDTFYVHNCFDALQTLVNMNLLFKCLGKESGRPEGTPFHIFLKMEACEYKDFQIIYTEKIRYALCDLFNSSTSTLNLSEFRNHMEFGSIVVPLSSTKTMTDTLFYASKLFAQTTHLNMQKNRIKSCKGFSNLNNFIKLKSLDLRNNLIDSIDDLQGFPTLDLVELWLVSIINLKTYIFSSQNLFFRTRIQFAANTMNLAAASLFRTFDAFSPS